MWQEDLAHELTEAPPRERREILARYELQTGYKRQRLYTIAAEYGFVSARSPRADKGNLRSCLTDQQIEGVASLIHVTRREVKGPIMPTERAIQIAEDNGWIEPGQVTASTMNRLLRDRQLSKIHQKAPTPHTEMRSLHPNHVHEVDVSVCIQYYLRNGRLAMMDERDYYKNKPHNFAKIKTRLLRYVLVDHFSGAFWLKYYDTTGETQGNMYDFLKEAWGMKPDMEKLPFRGVCFILLWDAGSANVSKAMSGFLDRLGVATPKGRPRNPRRQGAVEVAHNIIEPWFESALRLQPATSVDELNQWARDFSIWFQAARKHTRHGMTRTVCWLLIREDQLRELPADDILQDLFANPEEERTVNGDYTISYRGNEYSLKHVEGLFRGAKVWAVLKPYKWPVIEVAYREAVYEAAPVEKLPAIEGGFSVNAPIIDAQYRAQPETETQRATKRMENMAYGEDPKKDAIPFEGLKVYGHHADKVDLTLMPRRGTPMEIDRGITETQISMTEFLKRLMRATGPVSRELNASLRAEYGESIEATLAEKIIRDLEENPGQSFVVSSSSLAENQGR